MQTGPQMVPVHQQGWGLPGKAGAGDTEAVPGNSWPACSPHALLSGEIHGFPGKLLACAPAPSDGRGRETHS